MNITFDGQLEIRQVGGARILSGSFPYNSLATVNSRGRVRKETISSRAFRFAIETEPERRIDLLIGHDFGKPVASRQAGTLAIEDTADAVVFRATLPEDAPTWVVDAERAISAGLMTGISPGFQVPPRSIVPDAERLVDEPGNPGVQIRQVNHAVLREISVVTNPVYEDSAVELRSDDFRGDDRIERMRSLWL